MNLAHSLTLAGQDEALPQWVRDACDQAKLELWQANERGQSMSAAKTTAQRQAEWKQARKDAGLVEFKRWVHPDDVPEIQKAVEKAARRRQRGAKQAP